MEIPSASMSFLFICYSMKMASLDIDYKCNISYRKQKARMISGLGLNYVKNIIRKIVLFCRRNYFRRNLK
jgi:hypothetical protein